MDNLNYLQQEETTMIKTAIATKVMAVTTAVTISASALVMWTGNNLISPETM